MNRLSLGQSRTEPKTTEHILEMGTTATEDLRIDNRQDLTSRSAIHDLVVSFYRELVMDEKLGPLFEEVAEVDWREHIPHLIDYWCRILLGESSYQGAILNAHMYVHQKEAFTADHFDRWYRLFVSAIDERWAGPMADKAKSNAAKVAASLARRLPQIPWEAPSK